MRQSRIVLLGIPMLLSAFCGWAAESRTASLNVNVQVVGRVAFTYRTVEGMLAANPSAVVRPVPDSQLVRYELAPGAGQGAARVVIRGVTNLASPSYRLLVTVVEASQAGHWQVNGETGMGGQTVVVEGLAYDQDKTLRIAVDAGGPAEGSWALFRFQIQPN